VTWLLISAVSDSLSSENDDDALLGSRRASMRTSYSRIRLFQALPISNSVNSPFFPAMLGPRCKSHANDNLKPYRQCLLDRPIDLISDRDPAVACEFTNLLVSNRAAFALPTT
jgi:hypothetical protein